MDRGLPLFCIGMVMGGGLGFAIAAASGVTFDGHDHSNPAHHSGADSASADHAAMDHGDMDHAAMHDTPLDIPAADAPQVSVVVTPDPMTGYNLHITTRNFAFSPQNASLANVPGEGHAHLYINGVKHSRVYGPWQHLADLPKGENLIEVSLNANDHRPLAVQGALITARTTVIVE